MSPTSDDAMRWPSIRERVGSAFDEATAAVFGQQYLDALLASWREIVQALRRNTLLLVALLVAFVLLQGAKGVQLSLGPIRLTNVSSVLTVIPAITSVLLYELVALVAALVLYRDMVGEMVRRIHPSVYDSDLHYLLAPSTVVLFGGGSRGWEALRASAPGHARKVLDATSIIAWTGILVGPIGYIYYAYGHLYADRHASDVAVSISLAVTLVYVVRAAALVMDTEGQERT